MFRIMSRTSRLCVIGLLAVQVPWGVAWAQADRPPPPAALDPATTTESDFAVVVSVGETDVPINPGSSDSPLFNGRGEVANMNSMVFSRAGGFDGTHGTLILRVDAESRAERAGLRGGDGVVGVGTRSFAPVAEFEAARAAAAVDHPTALLVMRHRRLAFVAIEPRH